MMAASLALPVALFVFASTMSWISIHETADREIERTLDVSHEEALKPRPPYQGAAFFGVSRRRENEDGSFAGVIQASVLPEYFESFYARIGREPGSFFALGRPDGAVLARFPSVDRDLQLDHNGL